MKRGKNEKRIGWREEIIKRGKYEKRKGWREEKM